MRFEIERRGRAVLWFLIVLMLIWLSLFYVHARQGKIHYENIFSSLKETVVGFEKVEVVRKNGEPRILVQGFINNKSKVKVNTGSSTLFVDADQVYLGAGSLSDHYQLLLGEKERVIFSLSLGQERMEELALLMKEEKITFKISGTLNIRGDIKEHLPSLVGLHVEDHVEVSP